MHISVIYIIYIRHYRVALLFILSLFLSLSLLILSYLYVTVDISNAIRVLVCAYSRKTIAISTSVTRPKLGHRNALSLFRCTNWRGTFAERYVDHGREIVNRPCGKCTAHYRFIIIEHGAGMLCPPILENETS